MREPPGHRDLAQSVDEVDFVDKVDARVNWLVCEVHSVHLVHSSGRKRCLECRIWDGVS